MNLVLACALPFIYLYNAEGIMIKQMEPGEYPADNPIVLRAAEICKRNLDTCPVEIRIKATGHVAVLCESRNRASVNPK